MNWMEYAVPVGLSLTEATASGSQGQRLYAFTWGDIEMLVLSASTVGAITANDAPTANVAKGVHGRDE